VFGLIYNREAPSLARQFTAIERKKARDLAASMGRDKSSVVGGNVSTGLQPDGTIVYHVWTVREAQKFISSFFARFPEVLVYKKWCENEALSTGRLVNYLGRVRRFGIVEGERRKHVKNEAVNFMPSSLSNDINLLSCTATMKQFGKYGVEVLVPIHDAGLLRVPKDSLYLQDEIEGMWKELPKKYLPTNLPFPCDVSVGERWSDL